jgi:hypothetical protein
MSGWVRVLWVPAVVLGFAGQAVASDIFLAPDIISPPKSEVLLAATLPQKFGQGPADVFSRQPLAIARDYAPAMIWYRAALARDGQPTIAAAEPNEEDPNPLRYWIAENGDIVSRTGRGLFHLTYGNGSQNWYREFDCRLVNWPDGESKAIMNCDDGVQRTMVIPSSGTVVVDDVEYKRVVTEAPLDGPEAYAIPVAAGVDGGPPPDEIPADAQQPAEAQQ